MLKIITPDDAFLRWRVGRIVPVAVAKSVSWDEDEHPRGDDGRFIKGADIAAAKGDPAAEKKLRDRVHDPAERKKLDRALGVKGTSAGTKVGEGRLPGAGDKRAIGGYTPPDKPAVAEKKPVGPTGGTRPKPGDPTDAQYQKKLKEVAGAFQPKKPPTDKPKPAPAGKVGPAERPKKKDGTPLTNADLRAAMTNKAAADKLRATLDPTEAAKFDKFMPRKLSPEQESAKIAADKQAFQASGAKPHPNEGAWAGPEHDALRQKLEAAKAKYKQPEGPPPVAPKVLKAADDAVSQAAAHAAQNDTPEARQAMYKAMQAHPYYKEVEARLDQYGHNFVDRETWSLRQHTEDGTVHGRLKPERQQLHNEIVGKMLNPAAVAAPGTKPKVFFVIGAPASGKTTGSDAMSKRLGVQFTTVNPDEAKDHLPEYKGWNAGAVHEESAIIAERVKQEAIQNRHNVMMDITGKNDAKTVKQAEAFAKLGYDVHVAYVSLPNAKTAQRAWSRFVGNAFGKDPTKPPGRFVPPSFAGDDVDGKPGKTYEAFKAQPWVKSWSRVSTDVGKGQAPVIEDEGSR